jgi:hypothetical protein
MADKKISQLSSASTPLAGTEVLPIVQSSATVKVATNDLTVKNVRSNATTGILQIAGPAAAATRTMTVPDANFTVARTDAANSFSADQTLSTGNLVVGTSGKGIDFSANTGTAGMTSELLDWYEEGTWTPNQGPGLTVNGAFTSNGTYTRIGRAVTVIGNVGGAVDIAASAGGIICTNLPITVGYAAAGSVGVGNVNQSASCIVFSTAAYCGSAITATAGITFTATYFV